MPQSTTLPPLHGSCERDSTTPQALDEQNPPKIVMDGKRRTSPREIDGLGSATTAPGGRAWNNLGQVRVKLETVRSSSVRCGRETLAEGVGFEPTGGRETPNGFQNRRNRPLCQPSAGGSVERDHGNSVRRGPLPSIPIFGGKLWPRIPLPRNACDLEDDPGEVSFSSPRQELARQQRSAHQPGPPAPRRRWALHPLQRRTHLGGNGALRRRCWTRAY